MSEELIVSDWNTHYETSESRKIKNLTWVAVSNRMESGGYLELTEHPQAAMILGCWLAILEIASRQPTRGTIKSRSGSVTRHIGRISHLPTESFDIALPVLEGLGWLKQRTYEDYREIIGRSPGESPDDPPERREIFRTTRPDSTGQDTLSAAKTAAESFQVPKSTSKENHGEPNHETEDVYGIAAETFDLTDEEREQALNREPVPKHGLFNPETETVLDQVAHRIHARHPPVRRCGLAEAKKQLRSIARRAPAAKRVELLHQVDQNHAGWCESYNWRKDEGQYAKGLDNWLAPTKERYLESPPGALGGNSDHGADGLPALDSAKYDGYDSDGYPRRLM